jgi:hypothetical protein
MKRKALSLANAALLVPKSIINLTRSHCFIPEFSRLRGFAAWRPAKPIDSAKFSEHMRRGGWIEMRETGVEGFGGIILCFSLI